MTQNLLVNVGEMLKGLWESSGLANGTWQNYVMLLISFILFYLAIVKKFEPLLLLPIAFGMFLINIPGAYDVLWGTYPEGVEHTYENVQSRGLLWYLFYGVQNVIYPPLIFLGIGAMTDFGPLISNPKSMLIGAAAQLGVHFGSRTRFRPRGGLLYCNYWRRGRSYSAVCDADVIEVYE